MSDHEEDAVRDEVSADQSLVEEIISLQVGRGGPFRMFIEGLRSIDTDRSRFRIGIVATVVFCALFVAALALGWNEGIIILLSLGISGLATNSYLFYYQDLRDHLQMRTKAVAPWALRLDEWITRHNHVAQVLAHAVKARVAAEKLGLPKHSAFEDLVHKKIARLREEKGQIEAWLELFAALKDQSLEENETWSALGDVFLEEGREQAELTQMMRGISDRLSLPDPTPDPLLEEIEALARRREPASLN